jgi:[acyl-carrier-protein] S-malonyltransferase
MSYSIVFPGQGSQTVGMIQDLIESQSLVRETLQEADDALGMNLTKMILEGPAEDLNQTDNTQPALLAVSTAIYRFWQSQCTVAPHSMAGHSLGEYSALVASGALDYADALRLVKRRGEFMLQAVPAGTGAMAAILGLDDKLVEQICHEQSQGAVVAPVNYNSPGQLVIAGAKSAVERAMDACKVAGAKRALPLPVSVPSHCSLMKPAADKLAEALADIQVNEPNVAVINNVDVVSESTPEKIKEALVRQLYSPVRWTETVQHMAQNGVTQLVEVGAGKVLTGLTKRIDKQVAGFATCDQANIDKAMEAVNS